MLIFETMIAKKNNKTNGCPGVQVLSHLYSSAHLHQFFALQAHFSIQPKDLFQMPGRPEENGHCGRFFAAFIFYLFIRSINIRGDEANLSSGCLEENALKMSEGQRSGGLETMEEQQ